MTYTADFAYNLDGKTAVEEVKNITTRLGIILRKPILQVHGITVKEV